MKFTAREGQVVVAGFVGAVEKKSETLYSVLVYNKKGKEDSEKVYIAFTNPKEDKKGAKLFDLADKYLEVGQFVAVVANEVQNGEYKNYYGVSCELGPKKKD